MPGWMFLTIWLSALVAISWLGSFEFRFIAYRDRISLLHAMGRSFDPRYLFSRRGEPFGLAFLSSDFLRYLREEKLIIEFIGAWVCFGLTAVASTMFISRLFAARVL